MAEILSLVPLHCAFCLKHLPMDGAPTVACVRCSTPYCSADCRAKDKNEGCGMLWNDAELDGETDRPKILPRFVALELWGRST